MHTLWSTTLRKISKIGATRCQILRLNSTKFDFQIPLRELTALPQRRGREREKERKREVEFSHLFNPILTIAYGWIYAMSID